MARSGQAASFSREKRRDLSRESRRAAGKIWFLCYTGNVHSANARKFAVFISRRNPLTRKEFPRLSCGAGKDYCPIPPADEQWAREVSVDLGYVKHVDIPRVSASRILSSSRAPRCLKRVSTSGEAAEFFAAGRPVLLHCKLGTLCSPWARAWVLPKMAALSIVENLKMLRAAEQLMSRLSAGASPFCESTSVG